MRDLILEKTSNPKLLVSVFLHLLPDRDPAMLHWLYGRNPAGKGQVFFARDSDTARILAAVSFVPWRVSYQGQVVTVAQAVDGVVTTEYRGRHVFNRLMRYAIEAGADQFAFITGFPNRRSQGSILRTGWKALGELSAFVYPLDGRYLSSRLFQDRRLRGLGGALVSPFLVLRNSFASRSLKAVQYGYRSAVSNVLHCGRAHEALRSAHDVVAVRDEAFIRWRFLEHPHCPCTVLEVLDGQSVVGYIAFATKGDDCEVVDLVCPPEGDVLDGTLALLLSYARGAGLASVHVLTSPVCCLGAALRRNGFIEKKKIGAFIMRPLSEWSRDIVFADCFLTVADSDWW